MSHDVDCFADWRLEFRSDGTALLMLAGATVESSYHVSDGYVSFDSAELSLLRMEGENGLLRLSGLGATFVFAPFEG